MPKLIYTLSYLPFQEKFLNSKPIPNNGRSIGTL
jgi:hypothetical protein